MLAARLAHASVEGSAFLWTKEGKVRAALVPNSTLILMSISRDLPWLEL